jgi:peptidoglycan/xylan/chitin deacetylase (PgdA/CDA1 family)
VRVGLRICVNTLQGTLQGVPNLLRLFDKYQVRGTFFFAMGPDHSGRLLGRSVLQPWHRQRNLASRFYGTLLRPPHISRQAADTMAAVDRAGHETGLLAYDRVAWVKKAAFADDAWTRSQLAQAIGSYESVFHKRPQAFAAPAWQVNPQLFRLEEELEFNYASDVRGRSLFLPVLQGVESRCPQLPTTLPTIADLLKQGGEINRDNVHEYLYADSQYLMPHGHTFSLDAEMEGMALLPLMEKLVVMWKGYGEGITTLGQIYESVDKSSLSQHQVGWSRQQTHDYHVATQAVPL